MAFKRSGNVSSIIMFQPSEKLRFSVHEHKIMDEDKSQALNDLISSIQDKLNEKNPDDFLRKSKG